MPPRYAYWTILIDQKPTAFRAREREELLPTFHQLRRKNTDVVMKWFARGRLWESPEEALAAQRAQKPPREPRGRDWRPGGEHRDPRERFKKRSQAGPPRSDRPWVSKPPTGGPPRGGRPWKGKPPAGAPRRDGPTGKPPWHDKNRKPAAAGARKPFSPRDRKPPSSRGRTDQQKAWQADRPRGTDQRKPWRDAPDAPPKRNTGTPSSPPPEPVVTKPKPPERG